MPESTLTHVILSIYPVPGAARSARATRFVARQHDRAARGQWSITKDRESQVGLWYSLRGLTDFKRSHNQSVGLTSLQQRPGLLQ